jgi:hypothetical protein
VEARCAEVAGGLEEAPVHAVEERVERQDHERDVAVDEAEDHARGAPVEPVARRVEHVRPHQRRVHPAVLLEEVDPGEHPHEVRDEERRDEAREEEALPATAETRDEVRDGIRDQEREEDGDPDVGERPQEDRLEPAARGEVGPDELERLRVPVGRVPFRPGRLEDRVHGPERDARDDVERDEEEEREPGDPGQREARPEEPAGPPRAAFGSRHPP